MTEPTRRCDRCFMKFLTEDDKNAHDSSRNITKAEYLAMLVFGKEYSESRQSARCFYRSLSQSRTALIQEALDRILEKEHEEARKK